MAIQKIGVLTSGGDAPGMNAAIRAVTRSALYRNWEVVGIRDGYAGLLKGTFVPMTFRTVSGIIQNGGTMLGSARCLEFHEEAGRQLALDRLRAANIDALVVIGGNGSQTGALALHQMGFPVNGVASTIDNDLAGSDITIGVDTALNIALEAIDRLKVTATSHHRAFLVEVMGRQCGYLALMAAIAGGAEAVVLPELEIEPDRLAAIVKESYDRGKSHAIIVVAEGATNNADSLLDYFRVNRQKHSFEIRETRLGHVQRGGTPGAFDRLLGSRLGARAVEALAARESGVLAGSINGKMVTTPLAEIVGKPKALDESLIELAGTLA